jgi:hypothetical protein
MTIKAIEVQLFQPHEVTILKPAEGFTVITGSSRAGKTSLVRAIKKAIENKPRGDFLSWFADDSDESQVAIEFDDDSHIVWVKSSRVNSYTVSTLDKPLKAIRTDVPEEVSNITRMSSVNIHSQLDPYFMLQPPYTPGEIGRMFNEAVKLEIIDATLTETNKALREISQQKKFQEAELEQKKEESEQYKNMHEVEVLLHDLNNAIETKDKITGEIKVIQMMLSLIGQVEVKLEPAKFALGIKDHLDPILELITEKDELDREVQRIQATLGMISVAESEIDKLNKIISLKGEIDEVVEIAQNASKINSEHTLIKNIVRDIINTENRLSDENHALEHRKNDLSQLLRSSQLKFCPFCNQVMTKDAIKHLEEHGV